MWCRTARRPCTLQACMVLKRLALAENTVAEWESISHGNGDNMLTFNEHVLGPKNTHGAERGCDLMDRSRRTKTRVYIQILLLLTPGGTRGIFLVVNCKTSVHGS